MLMKKSIVLITFDIFKPDYPTITYSIASILATLKKNKISFSHYPINIQQYIGKSSIDVNSSIKEVLSEAVTFFRKFDFIAIGVTRWSVEHTNKVLDLIGPYDGKIILGGYEITAIKEEDLIHEFPKADYFIKGYAEKALVKLINGEYGTPVKVIFEPLDDSHLFSPYSTGIISPNTRKIHWETKRGCKFSCGFCEWGNVLNKSTVFVNKENINKDIDIFSNSNIEEINILDGTFNIQNDYQEILESLITKTNAQIVFQARFEALTDSFLSFCSLNKKRVHLEFGLQTIHEEEMKVIGRKNIMERISANLKKLNESDINYEVSIIYSIPKQTVQSFIDTIEFLRVNNCKIIRAFPLQIPRNSALEEKKEEYKIAFKKDEYNVTSVASSISFTAENRIDMDHIAQSLCDNSNQIIINKSDAKKIANQKYQYDLPESWVKENIKFIRNEINRIIEDTFEFLNNDNSSRQMQPFKNLLFLILDKKATDETVFEHYTGNRPIIFVNESIENTKSLIVPGRRYHYKGDDKIAAIELICRFVLGESGHIYTFREFRFHGIESLVKILDRFYMLKAFPIKLK